MQLGLPLAINNKNISTSARWKLKLKTRDSTYDPHHLFSEEAKTTANPMHIRRQRIKQKAMPPIRIDATFSKPTTSKVLRHSMAVHLALEP